MIESIMRIAAPEVSVKAVRTGPRDAALRAGRTCYDHLAGHLGVSITDALIDAGHLDLGIDAGEVTDSGLVLFDRAGIDVDVIAKRGRILCRPCLDWSERRPHLAGAIGAALCSHCFDNGWIRRIEGTRAVVRDAKWPETAARDFWRQSFLNVPRDTAIDANVLSGDVARII